MFNENSSNCVKKKNEELLKEVKLLGEILEIYKGVLNAVHAVSSQKVRKLLEDFVTT